MLYGHKNPSLLQYLVVEVNMIFEYKHLRASPQWASKLTKPNLVLEGWNGRDTVKIRARKMPPTKAT